MSTNEYSSFRDKLLEYNEAEKQMKEARKQFVNLIRRTGTALRKFIPNDPANRQSISVITTHVNSSRDRDTEMQVSIVCGSSGFIDTQDIMDIEQYLRDHNWNIHHSFHINETFKGKHHYAIYCT